jgi:hypothetical protein
VGCLDCVDQPHICCLVQLLSFATPSYASVTRQAHRLVTGSILRVLLSYSASMGL